MRIDMTTREWHELLKPVIPHALNNAEFRDLAVIRVEAGEYAIYAVATDQFSLAAERHQLDCDFYRHETGPVHVRLSDAKASLALFQHSKDYDPPMRITIDTVAVPIIAAGRHTSVRRLAITLETDDGTRLVMHDQRDQSHDPLARWRDMLSAALSRDQATAAPALNLNAQQLGRWSAACRKGERLAVFTGRKGADLVLIAVEQHFLGVWKPQSYLESPAEQLAESPWHAELVPAPSPLLTASGVLTAEAEREKQQAAGRLAASVLLREAGEMETTGPATLPDAPGPAESQQDLIEHAAGTVPVPFRQPGSTGDAEHELGPWITAGFDGTDCAGPCGNGIDAGDKIRADGLGGWLCAYCGTGDDDTPEDGEDAAASLLAGPQ